MVGNGVVVDVFNIDIVVSKWVYSCNFNFVGEVWIFGVSLENELVFIVDIKSIGFVVLVVLVFVGGVVYDEGFDIF